MKNITFNQLKKIIKESYEDEQRAVKDAQRNGLYYTLGFWGSDENGDFEIIDKGDSKEELIPFAREAFRDKVYDLVIIYNPNGKKVKSYGRSIGLDNYNNVGPVEY